MSLDSAGVKADFSSVVAIFALVVVSVGASAEIYMIHEMRVFLMCMIFVERNLQCHS